MSRLPAAIVLLVTALVARAGEPELIPLHAPVIVVQPCPPPAFEQPSRLAVWQHYAVDRHGRFRPAVPLIPGQYNAATAQPRLYMPYIFN